MANIISGSFIGIDQNSSSTPQKSFVRQFVDILQEDIQGLSSTRKKYEVFVTGNADQSLVKSSLFHTVYDQDFTLSTSNALLDFTIGTYSEDVTVENDDGTVTVFPRICGKDFAYDAKGKITGFTNSELMIREKVNIYRQYAQTLLGDANQYFSAPHGEPIVEGGVASIINAALFLNVKRLFTRDNIFKGSFNLKLYKNGSFVLSDFVDTDTEAHGESISNLDLNPSTNAADGNEFYVIRDAIASTNLFVSPVAGEISTLTDPDGNYVGLIYYDKGILVLDIEKVFNPDQILRGIIDSNNTAAVTAKSGPWYIKNADNKYIKDVYTVEADAQAADADGTSITVPQATSGLSVNVYIPQGTFVDIDAALSDTLPLGQPLISDNPDPFYSDDSIVEDQPGFELFEGKLYPDFVLKASIDDVLDHFCGTRFGDSAESAIAFRNETVLNSRQIFCRAAPSQLNYSTNPTYTDDDGKIIAISEGGVPFSYVTTVGLYDSVGSLVAVAKTSRPIEKNRETDLSIRIRLDF